MNAIVFNVSVNKFGDLLHLGIDGETPVEKNIYVKLFGHIPKKDYKVVYYLNSDGKYFVNSPKNNSTWSNWPYLTLERDDNDEYDNNLAYVCKIPKAWYGKRVSRRVLS